jgi:hypothetical protein
MGGGGRLRDCDQRGGPGRRDGGIRENPLGYMRLIFVKFFRLWFEPIGYTLTARRSQPLAALLWAGHCILILLAFYGVWVSRSSAQVLFPVHVLLIYFAIMHNIVAPMPRFRLPVEPYLVLFAALAVSQIWKRGKSTGSL